MNEPTPRPSPSMTAARNVKATTRRTSLAGRYEYHNSHSYYHTLHFEDFFAFRKGGLLHRRRGTSFT